jgi:hypothetical protein
MNVFPKGTLRKIILKSVPTEDRFNIVMKYLYVDLCG